MKAEEVVTKVTRRNVYNTEQGIYEPAASLNDKGELMVTFKPTAPAPAEGTHFIAIRFNKNETRVIRNAFDAGEPRTRC